jgi:hypothetical protein
VRLTAKKPPPKDKIGFGFGQIRPLNGFQLSLQDSFSYSKKGGFSGWEIEYIALKDWCEYEGLIIQTLKPLLDRLVGEVNKILEKRK